VWCTIVRQYSAGNPGLAWSFCMSFGLGSNHSNVILYVKFHVNRSRHWNSVTSDFVIFYCLYCFAALGWRLVLTGWQHQLSADAAADSAVVNLNEPSDQHVQVMEQDRLVLQLKQMIRDRENALACKDADLKVSFMLFESFECCLKLNCSLLLWLCWLEVNKAVSLQNIQFRWCRMQ